MMEVIRILEITCCEDCPYYEAVDGSEYCSNGNFELDDIETCDETHHRCYLDEKEI
jgi:hypothetical protein